MWMGPRSVLNLRSGRVSLCRVLPVSVRCREEPPAQKHWPTRLSLFTARVPLLLWKLGPRNQDRVERRGSPHCMRQQDNLAVVNGHNYGPWTSLRVLVALAASHARTYAGGEIIQCEMRSAPGSNISSLRARVCRLVLSVIRRNVRAATNVKTARRHARRAVRPMSEAKLCIGMRG